MSGRWYRAGPGLLGRNLARLSPVALASCWYLDEGGGAMFTSGGGGGLPQVNSPLEALIVLLFFAVVVWLIARYFNG